MDDSPLDRLRLKRSLARAFRGALVQAVGSDLKELEQALEEGEWHAVVIDYSLGWADGFEALRIVRSRWRDCKAILFTVMPSEQLFSRAMNAGFDACLTKSDSLEHLKLAVASALADGTSKP